MPANADTAAVAKETGLREDVLKRWVKYLKTNDQAAADPSLDEWRTAAPEKLAEVAKAYQQRYEANAQTGPKRWTSGGRGSGR